MASALRTAIYERLATDPTMQGLLGAPDAIYHQRAPAGTAAPYIIFQKQTGNPEWTFGANRSDHLQHERWLIKAVCTGGSATPAEDAADRIDELMHDAPLQVAGATVRYCRRASDVEYPESNGPDLYHHRGAIYQIDTEPA